METKNWKTTVASVVSALAILLTQVSNVIDSDPNTILSMEAVVAALGILGVGWFAKDK